MTARILRIATAAAAVAVYAVADQYTLVKDTVTNACAQTVNFTGTVAVGGVALRLNKWDATVAPTANEDTADGYAVGSVWVDVTADTAYVCADATGAAAVWRQIDQTGYTGGTSITTLGTVTTGTLTLTTELTGALSVADHTSTGNIASASCYGGVVTNTGAGGGIVLTLPAALKGMSVLVVLTVAQDVDLNPNGSDRILVSTNANGDAISSDATIGTCITLVSPANGQWMPLGEGYGTWTDVD